MEYRNAKVKTGFIFLLFVMVLFSTNIVSANEAYFNTNSSIAKYVEGELLYSNPASIYVKTTLDDEDVLSYYVEEILYRNDLISEKVEDFKVNILKYNNSNSVLIIPRYKLSDADIFTKIQTSIKNAEEEITLNNLSDFDKNYITENLMTHLYKVEPYVGYIEKINYVDYKDSLTLEIKYKLNRGRVLIEIIQSELKANEIVKEELKLEGLSEGDKVKKIHDYLVKEVEKNRNNHDLAVPYRVLYANNANYEGYTKAFQLLLNKAGVKNISINGYVERNKEHMWNLVSIDNEWNHIDLTWNNKDIIAELGEFTEIKDDALKLLSFDYSRAYYLLTDKYIEKSHSWDKSLYPVSESELSRTMQLYNFKSSSLEYKIPILEKYNIVRNNSELSKILMDNIKENNNKFYFTILDETNFESKNVDDYVYSTSNEILNRLKIRHYVGLQLYKFRPSENNDVVIYKVILKER